jgi:signal transduction histidine kinase
MKSFISAGNMNVFRIKPVSFTLFITLLSFVGAAVAAIFMVWLFSDYAVAETSAKFEALISSIITPVLKMFTDKMVARSPAAASFMNSIRDMEYIRFVRTALGIGAINLIAAGFAGGLIYFRFREGLVGCLAGEDVMKMEIEKTKAEILGQMKSEFLVSMSHELRTPLNGILGLSESMIEDEKDPSKAKTLRTIYNSGRSLLELINEILDLAKLDSGKMPLNKSAVALEDLVDDASSMVKAGFADKKLNFKLDFSPEVPGVVETDAGKLNRVLVNLVSNAYKFTENGGVEIRVRKNDSSKRGKRGNLLFMIEDTGCGISEERMPFIFESFVHGESMDGNGLGLPISRGLVELLGGEIWCISEPDKGSTFSFTINASLLS